MGEGWLSFSTCDLIRRRDRKAGYMWVLSVLNRHSTVTFALDSVEASTSAHCRYLSTIYYHYQVARYLVTRYLPRCTAGCGLRGLRDQA